MTKIAWHCTTKEDLNDLKKRLDALGYCLFNGNSLSTIVMDQSFSIGKIHHDYRVDMLYMDDRGSADAIEIGDYDAWLKQKDDHYRGYQLVEFHAGDSLDVEEVY